MICYLGSKRRAPSISRMETSTYPDIIDLSDDDGNYNKPVNTGQIKAKKRKIFRKKRRDFFTASSSSSSSSCKNNDKGKANVIEVDLEPNTEINKENLSSSV